jgi:hypothetical protein
MILSPGSLSVAKIMTRCQTDPYDFHLENQPLHYRLVTAMCVPRLKLARTKGSLHEISKARNPVCCTLYYGEMTITARATSGHITVDGSGQPRQLQLAIVPAEPSSSAISAGRSTGRLSLTQKRSQILRQAAQLGSCHPRL